MRKLRATSRCVWDCDPAPGLPLFWTPLPSPSCSASIQVAALAGLDVLLMDTSAAALDRARDGIAASLQRAVGKKKLAADAAEASLARIAPHQEMEVHTPRPFVDGEPRKRGRHPGRL